MKLAILGASSFCGSSFAEYCGESALLLSRSNGYDLTYGVEKIVGELRNYEATHVINFAALSMVAQSWDRPQDWMRTNVEGLIHLFDRLRSVKSLKKFIHFSTPEVYGSNDYSVAEGWQWNPSTPYALSRMASDVGLMMYAKQGLPAIITRCANVYGEGQQTYRLIPKAILCALEGKPFPLEGDGSSIRSFIHAEDMAQALMAILRSGVDGKTYHISGCKPLSILELLNKIETIAGPLILEHRPERFGLDRCYRMLDYRIRELLWRPEIDLEDGLKRVVEHLQANPKPIEEYAHKPMRIDQDMICVG